jgi:hypothetical protein
LLSQIKGLLLRIPIVCALITITLFIFVNPSRQSVIFVFLGVLVVCTLYKSTKSLKLILLIFAIIVVIINNLEMTDVVLARFFSTDVLETNRTQFMAIGLGKIEGPSEWLFGKGLDLVFENSINPHNNYIFTVMRIGLIGVVLLFLPFLRALLKLIYYIAYYGRKPWFDRNKAAFLMVTVLFVLYHSFFGYPHLDALNGPIVWFGLALWVIYNRDLQVSIMIDRRALHFR